MSEPLPYYIALCEVTAKKSDAPLKCGAVMPGREGAYVSLVTAYNGIPLRLKQDRERYAKGNKRIWVEHAERRLIAKAAMYGIPTLGATLYVSRYPCIECARLILEAGFSELFVPEPDWESTDPLVTKWNFPQVRDILEEARDLEVTYYEWTLSD